MFPAFKVSHGRGRGQQTRFYQANNVERLKAGLLAVTAPAPGNGRLSGGLFGMTGHGHAGVFSRST
jgi:hypothetical protein